MSVCIYCKRRETENDPHFQCEETSVMNFQTAYYAGWDAAMKEMANK
jgi:hypothetical protein